MTWPPPLEYHEHRWDRVSADVRDGRGPERVGGNADPTFRPPPFLGFTNRATDPDPPDHDDEPDDMPDLWEGDQA